MTRVTALRVHPVKATAPVTVDEAVVELSGLRDDRRWAVIDVDGRRLNATTHDRLLTVTATPDASGALTLTRPGDDALTVPRPIGGRTIAVDVSRLASMVDAGDLAATWFSRVLDQPVRLAWQDDPSRRVISPDHGGTGDDPLSLADTGPILLTTRASLDQLNSWIAEEQAESAMSMQRFRPNVVVDGDLDAFVEDAWRTIRIGEVGYRFAEHCDRCVVTTMDPVTLVRGREPIRTLARHRRWDGKTWFGIRIVPMTTGTIAVGDEVLVGTRHT